MRRMSANYAIECPSNSLQMEQPFNGWLPLQSIDDSHPSYGQIGMRGIAEKGTMDGRYHQQTMNRRNNISATNIWPNWQAFCQSLHGTFRARLQQLLQAEARFRPWPSSRSCWPSLSGLLLFLLLLLHLATFSYLHHFRHPSPSVFFLLALFTLLLFFSTCNAISALLRHKNAPLKMRPLLLLTCLCPLLGLPLLWLPPPLCFRLPLPPSLLPFQCHARPFPLVSLALLLASFAPLRPLLQHWLLKLRQGAALDRLCVHPLECATFFNHFCARMEAIANNDEERELIEQWKKGFGQQLRTTIERGAEGELAKGEHFNVENGGDQGKEEEERGKKRQKWRPILKEEWRKRKSSGRRSEKKRRRRRRVQFSQILLLREINSVQNEVGQLVEMDKHRKYVMESLYADFVRDFHLRMSSRGHMLSNSARQIFARFGPVETMHYTKMTANSDGQAYGYANWGEGGGRGDEMEGVKEAVRRRRRSGKEKADREYATIDSANEGTTDLGKVMAKFGLAHQLHPTQLRPQVPSTPIPQTTPTDPQGPLVIRTIYENFATLNQVKKRLEEVKEEEREEEEGKKKAKEVEEEREETGKRREQEAKKREEEEEEACHCPLGADCLVLGAQASAHYYYLRPNGAVNGRFLEAAEEEEYEEEEEEACCNSRI